MRHPWLAALFITLKVLKVPSGTRGKNVIKNFYASLFFCPHRHLQNIACQAPDVTIFPMVVFGYTEILS